MSRDDFVFDEEARQRALDALDIVDKPREERVDRIARLAAEMFQVPMVSVSILDREREWRLSEIGLGGRVNDRVTSFCDVTIRQQGTLVVEDASIDPIFATNPFVIEHPRVRFYAGHPLKAPGGEQIGTLCIIDDKVRTLTSEQRGLLEELTQWVQAEITRDFDIDQARLMQRALLPQHLPVVEGYRIAADAIGAGSLMGDFYDLCARDGSLTVTLADVMGKGIGPAIVAAGVRASLRTSPERSLVTAVDEAEGVLEEALLGTSCFVTAVHARIEISTGELTFVDAGHGLAYILRADGSWVRLPATGLPLGMSGLGVDRTEGTEHLDPGDVLLCCSDGLLDVLDTDDPLGQIRRAVRTLGPDGAVQEALRLARDRGATDDVTAIVVERML
ncbi:hypothetical protein GCM10009808_11010 [Microbacterium sediminicola]|uniref:PPM-type phosphatase domain-containing protein n=1 Tax=Microbacterium sediminicola TaxID=415210 RepID=A0ABP4TZB5_9MICO